MEKILNFKKEVLTLNINTMIDFYPGNPNYIGKDRKEEFKESVRKGKIEDYKGRFDKESYELYKELVASDEVFHCYVSTMSEAMLNNIYVEAQFSIGSLSLDRLNYELQKFESYSYEEFFAELDLLSSRFTNQTIDRRDKLRFKAIFKKHFKYSTPIAGKITRMFVNSLRDELKMRVKYLELLKKDIREMIAIKMKSLSNNVTPVNNNTMEIDYDLIFKTALDFADDTEQIKAYFIRQQKKAGRDDFYERDDFYKGLLKFASQERERFKESLEAASFENPVDNVFILGGHWGIYYSYKEIDLMEQIIHEICNDDNEEQTKTDKYSHYTGLQWGAIFYYVNSKILSDEITIESKLSTFKKKHNIKHTFKTFKVGYYNAYKKIIETNDYPTKKLKPIVPFFQQYYKKIVVDVKNDIEVLEDYENENQ